MPVSLRGSLGFHSPMSERRSPPRGGIENRGADHVTNQSANAISVSPLEGVLDELAEAAHVAEVPFPEKPRAWIEPPSKDPRCYCLSSG
jgi:hypothetical protein